jgi:sirohydrochlorin cobaltochelatase
MADRGLILFAHGARDLRWAEPFERLLCRLQERRPDLPAALAFLEHIAPDLPTAARQLAGRGVVRIRIVPLFFGRGGHLREDFPRMVAGAQEAAPGVDFEITPAAGEDAAMIEALADFALAGLDD